MRDLENNPCEVSHLRFASLLFEFLYQLYTNFSISITNDKLQHSNLSLSNLEPVLEFTKENYYRHISIKEISEIAHLQPEYFCRKFKQYMGQTYLDYLNELRLSHIYMDLLNSNELISNIMERHGFNNYKLFYKTFKKKFNCTPKTTNQISRYKFELCNDLLINIFFFFYDL